jgi:hypothetical protein
MSKRTSSILLPAGVRRYTTALAGIVIGCALAALAIVVTGTAVAQRPSDTARAVFDANHLPPLLTLPGERVDLAYEVHCAYEGVEDPEAGCDVRGIVYLRTDPRTAYRALPLEPASENGLRVLTATVPADVAGSREFEYFAELEAIGTGARIVVPGGGADSPYRSRRLPRAIDVTLGTHSFGSASPGSRIVSAPWGDGAASVGLESGRNLPAIGASAFDVEHDGTITLLDEAHRRVLRWQSSGAAPDRVPLSIDGRLADVSVDEDGSLYVLESVASRGQAPVVRHFDAAGRELAVVETADSVASQVRIGPDGPVVLQHPSHQWMPLAVHGTPSSPRDQRRNARSGRPLRSGGEVVVLRRERDLLVAVVSSRGVERSWRVTSRTPIAEVQLAEPRGGRFVLVARVYADAASEFVVLVLDRHGIAKRFSTPTDEWAEAAPLSRFRLAGGRLYKLGSDASAAFVTGYEVDES